MPATGGYCWAATAGAIDLGLILLEPQVDWYVGLSGVLHGFVAAGALVACLRASRSAHGSRSVSAAKLLWEQLVGPVPFTAAAVGGPVVVAAHCMAPPVGSWAPRTRVVRARKSRV